MVEISVDLKAQPRLRHARHGLQIGHQLFQRLNLVENHRHRSIDASPVKRRLFFFLNRLFQHPLFPAP